MTDQEMLDKLKALMEQINNETLSIISKTSKKDKDSLKTMLADPTMCDMFIEDALKDFRKFDNSVGASLADIA